MRSLNLRSKLVVSFAVALAATVSFHAEAFARNLYVSPKGDGSTGLTWRTAFPHPAQIDWKRVHAGDHIVLDGGTAGITYSGSAITLPKGNIVIRQSEAQGHNGNVTIMGGYMYPGPPIPIGITFGANNIHIVGLRRGGIKVTTFANQCVKMQANNCSLRNVAFETLTGSPPYGQGMEALLTYGGHNNHVLNCDFRFSIVPNAKEAPLSGPNLTVFNHCTFGNNSYGWWGNFGTGIYGARTATPAVNTTTHVANCIFGPYMNRGIDFQDGNLHVSNSMFLGAPIANLSAEMPTGSTGHVTVNRCTFWEPNFQGQSVYQHPLYQITTNGNGSITVSNSIAYGGVVHVPATQVVDGGGNVQYRITGNTMALAPTLVNPLYVDDATLSHVVGSSTISPRTFTTQSYALSSGSPATGKGCTITDVTSVVPAYGPTGGLPPQGGP